ncbi:hypothetical protein PsorP6_012974 [Peronosclerospora sorghi]|uniref:Uncharacterized protein n=1 Tax=Peronosclerospora sorghi TaxID=230839 RepID=A0ACC0WGD2_9STRA|nr:hypothetical protein PsorP6_012974 [Peronosclerospora sorghi]
MEIKLQFDIDQRQKEAELRAQEVELQKRVLDPFGTTNSALHTPARAALGLKTTCRCVVDTQALQQARSEAETRKRAAVQTALKLSEVQEAEILDTQKRKEEAARNRAEEEQKEREVREKAEIMRCKAFEAPSEVRAKLRRQIEIQLTDEEAQHQREMQRKMDEIEKNKELAHQRGKARVKKAEEDRRRAEELNLKAQQARAGRNAFWRLDGGMSRYGATFSEEFSAKKLPLYIQCLDGANGTGIIIMILRKIQNWTKMTTISEFCR